jgi:hypothetical protein
MPRKRYTTTADYLSMLRRMMTAAGRRVGEADAEELDELIASRDEMNQVIERAVDGLRADGYTWESIGAATGTTRQAALMKWGPTAKARRSAEPADGDVDKLGDAAGGEPDHQP